MRARPADDPTPHKRKPLFRASTHAYSRGDKILFASGIVLSLACAFFPWYVFFNQDQFGVRAVRLDDIPPTGQAPKGAVPAGRIAAPLQAEADPDDARQLDYFPTGTLPDPAEQDEKKERLAQPFPAPHIDYRLIHVVNGRAMIEDDSGVFVVQRGSLLPDDSRVAAIERRGGGWVMVTSRGKVLELE